MIDLGNAIIREKIPENANPNKIVDNIDKILGFNKPEKCREIKILTLKQMFQRLPITLVQVKASNTSENLLNKIRQIIIPSNEKAYNNIISSVKL